MCSLLSMFTKSILTPHPTEKHLELWVSCGNLSLCISLNSNKKIKSCPFPRSWRGSLLAGEINCLSSVEMKLQSMCSVAYANSRLNLVAANFLFLITSVILDRCSSANFTPSKVRLQESRNAQCLSFFSEQKHH